MEGIISNLVNQFEKGGLSRRELIQGLVALFDDGVLVTSNKDQLLLVDVDVWGGIMLVWGLLLAGTGAALAYGSGFARVFSIFLAFVSVILQIGFLSAYPIWSTIVIAMTNDTVCRSASGTPTRSNGFSSRWATAGSPTRPSRIEQIVMPSWAPASITDRF